jgi:hypothetical protein
MAYTICVPPAVDQTMADWHLEVWLLSEVTRHLREELAEDPFSRTRLIRAPILGRIYSFRVFDSTDVEHVHVFQFMIEIDADRSEIRVVDCGYTHGHPRRRS